MMKRLNGGNKMLILCAILVCLCVPVFACSQTPEESEQQMNRIKLEASYVYGESFGDDAETAYGNALSELLFSCNQLRLKKGAEPLKLPDLQPVAKEIRSFSDGEYTVFLYLPEADMMAIKVKSRAAIVAGSRPQSEGPKPQPQPQPGNNNVPASAKPQEQTMVFVPAGNAPQQVPSTLSDPDTDMLRAMIIQNTWTELKPLIIKYKSQGKIKTNGNTSGWSSVPDDAYAILFDADAGVIAFFSPSNHSERLNYKTNRVDNPADFQNCKFIVWYK